MGFAEGQMKEGLEVDPGSTEEVCRGWCDCTGKGTGECGASGIGCHGHLP